MKFRKLTIPNYQHEDAFGNCDFHQIEILVDLNSGIKKADQFDQKTTDFFLSDEVVLKLAIDSAKRFLNLKSADILSGKYQLTSNQLNHIKELLRVNQSELADLLGVDKSTITRLLNKEQVIKRDFAMLVIERLNHELESPGTNKILLAKIRQKEDENVKILAKALDVFAVAEFFIRFFEVKQDNVTHLKLQKLLYYAQGIGFGRFNCKLMTCQFVAWDHGPVIEEVYRKYKNSNNNPLISDENISINVITQDSTVLEILNETITIYGKYSAWALREKTHNETPWLETESSKIITDEKIIKFFKQSLV
jgi:uncharacterized phage-associated protein/DNA-binding transcriptional regulator YiaG